VLSSPFLPKKVRPYQKTFQTPQIKKPIDIRNTTTNYQEFLISNLRQGSKAKILEALATGNNFPHLRGNILGLAGKNCSMS